MANSGYVVANVVQCAPAYQAEALERIGRIAELLKKDAGAFITRLGVITTGEHTGGIVLFSMYEEMNGFARGVEVASASADFQAVGASGQAKLVFRNVIKIEDIGLAAPSAEAPSYTVLTRWGSDDLMLDRMGPMVRHFEENGAMSLRFGTILTGNAAGRRLLGVGYPSMDAIEKTYAALSADPAYGAFVSDVEIDFRNIVRNVG